MSEATKNSPSPSPTTSGGPLRTATIFSGSWAESTTSATMPRICRSARLHGAFEPPLHLAFDEVRDHLGVGLGDEAVALGLELPLEIEVVLDDAVVHDDNPARAVAVRMGVLFRRTPVSGPSGMADAVVAVNRLGVDGFLETRSFPALRRSSMCPLRTTATPAES